MPDNRGGVVSCPNTGNWRAGAIIAPVVAGLSLCVLDAINSPTEPLLNMDLSGPTVTHGAGRSRPLFLTRDRRHADGLEKILRAACDGAHSRIQATCA